MNAMGPLLPRPPCRGMSVFWDGQLCASAAWKAEGRSGDGVGRRQGGAE